MKKVIRWGIVALAILIAIPVFLAVFRIVSFVANVIITLLVVGVIVYMVLRATGLLKKLGARRDRF